MRVTSELQDCSTLTPINDYKRVRFHDQLKGDQLFILLV